MSKPLSPLAKKKLVIAALEDIKAHDIQAIDVRKLTSLFDWIIVASAANQASVMRGPRVLVCRHSRSKIVQCRSPGCTISQCWWFKRLLQKSKTSPTGLGCHSKSVPKPDPLRSAPPPNHEQFPGIHRSARRDL